MAFDRGILFDRTMPRGQRLRGEAIDEIVYHVEQNVPPAENYITRMEFDSGTKEFTVFMMDKSTGLEFEASEFTVPTAKGDPGDPNSLSIGTVTGGDDADATITGDAPNQTLSLVLPYGETNSLSIGTVEEGPAGATITGAAPTQTLNLVLPRGVKGDQGGGVPTGASWSDKQDFIDPGTTAQYYRGDKTWQTLNKAAVGLVNVDNTADSAKPVSTAQQTALDAKQNTISTGTTTQYYRGDKTWQTLNKAAVGLANVDNTSDANKPVSTATTTALNLRQLLSEKNQANGYAGLDSSGLIPSSLLPSFVDDVLEFANLAAMPATGETGKMYVALDTDKIYRWSGSGYREISGSPGSTDAVPEGSVNLYYTDARADARAAAALAARSVIAGTGLTGGGALSVNRTLSVSYGSSAGTACQGNDSRLTDTRTPTDNTVATAKLQDNAVTLAKLAAAVQASLGKADSALQSVPDGSVTTGKIVDANVTLAKLSSAVQTSLGKADSAIQAATLPYDVGYVAFGKDSTRALGTGDNPIGFRAPRAFVLQSVYFRAVTADASGNLAVRVNRNGSAITATATTIAAANQLTGGGQSGLGVSISAGDILTVEVTGIGTTPGKGLWIELAGTVG